MIKITAKKDCCGCHACYNICPLHCIKMNTDSEGFSYPVIDVDVCSDCGWCDMVCPIINPSASDNHSYAYACVNRNDSIREQSSSGGVFTALAEKVIRDDGVVFGASFDKDFNVQHSWTDSLDGLIKFRGSKYVQSSVGHTYNEAREFLKQGRAVLFSGTPCQVAGLQSFLGKDYRRLICIDIVCHGVPSPGVWQRYKKQMEERNQSKIDKVCFRVKAAGWRQYSTSFGFENGTEDIQPASKNIYMQGFLKDIYLRPSCYECRFKSLHRSGDLTLADFWGIENILPKMDDDKGTSLVLVNSTKGAEAFGGLRDNLIFERVDMERAIHYNPSAIRSVDYNPKRDKFFAEMDKADDICVLIDRYTRISVPRRAFLKVRGLLGKVKRRVMG